MLGPNRKQVNAFKGYHALLFSGVK